MSQLVNLEVQKMFDDISTILKRFAINHNLVIDKYWHGTPSWRFTFRNPKGGIACLELIAENSFQMEIYRYWWIDDFESGIRRSKTHKSDLITANDVNDDLEKAFESILAWDTDSLVDVKEGLKESWHKAYTSEQFAAFNDIYSFPIVKDH